ncbi:hypothetical protein FQA39_LY07071 [Lamprigera yunnana]|nr:hypothetical protein FQA39_LY07071 [Lamprigera yunnana]
MSIKLRDGVKTFLDQAKSRIVPLNLGTTTKFDTCSCENNTVEESEERQSIDLPWSIPKDYNVNNEARLLKYGIITTVVFYWYQRRKQYRVPTEWIPVGSVKKLYIYPLKSGHNIELESAICTKRGVMMPQLKNLHQLRDRSFLVFHEATKKFETARTKPQMVNIKITATSDEHITFNAPDMQSIIVKIPNAVENAPCIIKLHHEENIPTIDCGDEVANWLSQYLSNESSGYRLGYHDGVTTRNIDKTHAKYKKVYPFLQNKATGMYSDLTSFLLLNQSSVDDLASKISSDSITHRNFRPNILIEGAAPFAEDNWRWIKIGDAIFYSVKSCTRCVLTTVNPETAIKSATNEPLQTLRMYRKLKDLKNINVDGNLPLMGVNLGLHAIGKINVADTVFIVDSIPTSCVQLAKEQIIKYSDPKYNINDLKTGDCETMLFNQKIYYLNKSKSKWISVGLYYSFEFASVVKIFGRSKQYVIFKEEGWIQFHEQRENINKYFQTFDTMWKPRQIGSKTLTFEMIEEMKILKIEDMSGNEVYLGWESVSEVWSLESVLRYRLSYFSGSNFIYFYEDVIRAVAEMSGDVKINIYNIINRLSEKSDDLCCMLEVLLFMPEKALFDVQLERRIQEQGQKRVKKHLLKKMWMLYAQEHWTKSYDLKSAVERLYEELGALEFDADHEAIYGMERYYTVQQCEELRDKYKIGRKVCRKFLQGRTCSQCLVKRISEIGLRHFLDTVNKYIKDCSDSSSSSDEEVFKAVEQNGEETTEEEESKKSESESVTKLV